MRPADLGVDELDYCRAKDKADKSLGLCKFYVSALYVAMTRAVQSLTLLVSDPGLLLLALLGLQAGEALAKPVRASTCTSERRKGLGTCCSGPTVAAPTTPPRPVPRH